MPTLLRVGPYRIVVYLNDHAPPHVHAVGAGHAKFELGRRASEVRLTECTGVPRRQLRILAAAIMDHYDECVKGWHRVHGD